MVEKPKEPKSNLAVIGANVFNSNFFEVYQKLKPSWRNEMEVLDTIMLLLQERCRLSSHDLVAVVKGLVILWAGTP